LGEESFELVLFSHLLQTVDQAGRRKEPHLVSLSTRCQSQRNREVSLAGTRGANQTSILLLVNPLTSGQFQ
jgi:hypothetical protein